MGNGTWEFLEINFNDAGPGKKLNNSFEIKGVGFTNQSQLSPLRTIDAFNTGATGLMFGIGGVGMKLPFGAQWVIAHCGNKASPQLALVGLNGKQGVVSSTIGPPVSNQAYLLELTADKMASLHLDGGGGEGILISLKIGRKA